MGILNWKNVSRLVQLIYDKPNSRNSPKATRKDYHKFHSYRLQVPLHSG